MEAGDRISEQGSKHCLSFTKSRRPYEIFLLQMFMESTQEPYLIPCQKLHSSTPRKGKLLKIFFVVNQGTPPSR